MQVTNIFTIYDEKAEVFLPPFFVPTIGIATRAFADCVNSKEHQFGKHPSDYTLFYLGDFDDTTGEFNLGAKKSIGNGVEFVSKDHVTAIEGFENASDPSVFTDKNSGNSP